MPKLQSRLPQEVMQGQVGVPSRGPIQSAFAEQRKLGAVGRHQESLGGAHGDDNYYVDL